MLESAEDFRIESVSAVNGEFLCAEDGRRAGSLAKAAIVRVGLESRRDAKTPRSFRVERNDRSFFILFMFPLARIEPTPIFINKTPSCAGDASGVNHGF